MRPHLQRMLAAPSLALLVLACNKGPAEDALRVAEQEIAAARPVLERYAPDELAALESDVRRARAEMADGHYTDALRSVHRMPARVRTALGAAASGKEKEAEVWKGLADSTPRLQETIATRIAWLKEAERLPRGMDEAGFAAAPAELESVKRAWKEAKAAFESGNVEGAVRSGEDVRKRTETLASRLGLVFATPAPAPAPTSSPSPMPKASPPPVRPAAAPSPKPSPPPVTPEPEAPTSPSPASAPPPLPTPTPSPTPAPTPTPPAPPPAGPAP